MFPLHLWHVVEDVQSARRHEARARAASNRHARHARAAERTAGSVRQALAFGLIETGLRILTPRPSAEVRRVR